MFIELLLLWVVFNGRVTVEILIFGLIISAMVCYLLSTVNDRNMFFAHKFIYGKVKNRIKYYTILVIEIIKANIAVMDVILTPGKIENKPVIVHFDTKLKDPKLNILLANSITLTPGTITADTKDNSLTVLALDEDFTQDIDSSIFVKELERMDKEATDGNYNY